MLYYDFIDYEDFKERFGIIHHGNGTKNRKNKILLAYIKSKDLLHQARLSATISLTSLESLLTFSMIPTKIPIPI